MDSLSEFYKAFPPWQQLRSEGNGIFMGAYLAYLNIFSLEDIEILFWKSPTLTERRAFVECG